MFRYLKHETNNKVYTFLWTKLLLGQRPLVVETQNYRENSALINKQCKSQTGGILKCLCPKYVEKFLLKPTVDVQHLKILIDVNGVMRNASK